MQIVEEGKQPKKTISRSLRGLVVVFVLVAMVGVVVLWRVQTKYSDRIVEINDIGKMYETVLVFGAGLKARGQPGAVLEDRVLTAIDVYQAGKVEKVVMSGDNSTANHNEVQAMENFAVAEGLPEEVLVADHSGRSTLESCLFLRDEMVGQSVVLITQEYHLKRALFVCNELGVDAVGVVADRREYRSQLRYTIREWAASVVDWGEVWVSK